MEAELIKRQKTAIIILSIATLFLSVMCGYLLSSKGNEKCVVNNGGTSEQQPPSNSSNEVQTNSTVSNGKYKLGDTFVFDGLQLTLDTTYSFT